MGAEEDHRTTAPEGNAVKDSCSLFSSGMGPRPVHPTLVPTAQATNHSKCRLLDQFAKTC